MGDVGRSHLADRNRFDQTNQKIALFPLWDESGRTHRERGLCFAVRGNLNILAPPLVISENEFERALDMMDTLLGEFDQP